MATTGPPTQIADEQLLARAARGRRAAAEALVARYLHPAWRLALVSAGDEERAADAAQTGVCHGIAGARRDGSRTLGTDVLAATRAAATTDADGEAIDVQDGDTAAIAAFRSLEEPARALLWLTEVEGGDASQVAPIVGLTDHQAMEAIDAARSAYRDELAIARLAATADPNFTDALALLDTEQTDDHRAQLLPLVSPLPSGLAESTTERLLAEVAGGQRWLLAPGTRRALGAAAATIVALSLAGLAGGTDGGGLDAIADGPALAAPAAVELATAPDTAEPASSVSLPESTAPTRIPTSAGRSSDSSSTTTLRASDRARELDSVPAARTPSTTTPPRSSTSTTTDPPAAESPVPVPTLPPELADPIAGLLPDGSIPCTGIAAIDQLTSCTPVAPATDPTQPPGLPALPGLGG
jgi:DNA-directed RNA polymerase specialized sigma24 family protein